MILVLKDIYNLIAVEPKWRIKFMKTPLKIISLSHLWKSITPGLENVLWHRKYPPYCFPYQVTIKDLFVASLSLLWRTEMSWATCQHEELLKTWHCSHCWTWTLKKVITKILKHNKLVIWGLLTVDMFESEFFFFFYLQLSKLSSGPTLIFSSLWCFSLTVNI